MTIQLWILNGVLDHFQISKAVLVGSSFGGYLAMLCALKMSVRIEALVLEGCPALISEMKTPLFIKLMVLPLARNLLPRLPVTKGLFHKILSGLGHGFSVRHKSIPPGFIEWYGALFNHTDSQKQELELMAKVLPYGKMNGSFILPDAEISRISCPVLFLWGEKDPFGGRNIGDRLKETIPHASIVYRPHSSHLPWIDDPQKNGEEIRRFLKMNQFK